MFRPQKGPPVYQPPQQRSNGSAATSNSSLGLPRMSQQPTIRTTQPVNLRYAQSSTRPSAINSNPRPASFYPSVSTVQSQGSYSYPTYIPQQRVSTGGGQPVSGGYQNRPPLSNSSARPSYPPVTTPGLPRQASGSQPAVPNGRPIYGQVTGYGLNQGLGQLGSQTANPAQLKTIIRPGTARSVPLHLERARCAVLL